MKHPILTIETTRHVHPSGRAYLEFAPVFTPDICASGYLRFAVWQAWEDEPETHGKAIVAALAGAHEVLAQYGAWSRGLRNWQNASAPKWDHPSYATL